MMVAAKVLFREPKGLFTEGCRPGEVAVGVSLPLLFLDGLKIINC
jgi:hypothetical protein